MTIPHSRWVLSSLTKPMGSNLCPLHWKCGVLTMSVCMRAKSLQSCTALCDSMDHSPPGSYVHGILQARIQEWVAMLSSRASSWPRDWTCVTWIVGGFFTHWATWKAPSWYMLLQFNTTPFRCHDELQSIFCCIQTLPSEPGIMLQLWNMWISLLICASLTLRAPFLRT